MFSYKIDENIELRLLEERHAEEAFSLLEQNRNHYSRNFHSLSSSSLLMMLKSTLELVLNVSRPTMACG